MVNFVPAANNVQYSWGGASGFITQLNIFLLVHLSFLFSLRRLLNCRCSCLGDDFDYLRKILVVS